jgi:uncharacterized coiled-coil DUF342 family protein
MAVEKEDENMEVDGGSTSKGMTSYYATKIGGLERETREKTLNLQRLTAQRNELNMRVRALRASRRVRVFAAAPRDARARAQARSCTSSRSPGPTSARSSRPCRRRRSSSR